MLSYLFILGRKSELCYAELSAVLDARYPKCSYQRVHESVVLVTSHEDEDLTPLQQILGGVLKIARLTEIIQAVPTEKLEEIVAKTLVSILEKGQTKVTFGIGEYGRESLDSISQAQIKKHLKNLGIVSRFVDGVRSGLSASVLLHQDTEEILIVKNKDVIYLSYICTVQNIDDWTRRDRQKPGVNRKRGMLPPKVARQMVNLASPSMKRERILDPFCGTGTVLLESLMLGKIAIGSDIRQDAVVQTRQNLEWFKLAYPGDYEDLTVLSDATTLNVDQLQGKVDAIVAEGFLGPLTPQQKELDNIFKGLEKLYIGALKNWSKILLPGGRVCLALPKIEIGKTTYSLKSLIDRSGVYGYNISLAPLIYDRPDSIVKREIFLLEYKK